MIEGRKNIVAWFEHTGFAYFTIYQQGHVSSGNPSYKSDALEGVTASQASQQLDKLLSLIGRGKFTIIAHEDPKQSTKGNYKTDFELSSFETGTPASSAPVTISGVPEDKVQQMIADALQKDRQQREFDEMKKKVTELTRENKELERKANEPMTKFVAAVTPHLGPVIQGFFPNAQLPAVAGTLPAADADLHDNVETDEVQTEAPTAEELERLGYVLGVFKKADPDYVSLLEKMAAKVEDDPAILNTLKMFL